MSSENRKLPYTPWQEVSRSDPFGRVERPIAAQVNHLLGANRFEDATIRELRKHPDIQDAAELFGKAFLGPDVIISTFGAGIEDKNVPNIPFTMDELERAQELDMLLILRISQLSPDSPLTIPNMGAIMDNDIIYRDQVASLNWFEEEQFYTDETPRHGWALVGKDLRDGTKGARYNAQIGTIEGYLKDAFYKDAAMPGEYRTMIADFNENEAKIDELLGKAATHYQAYELLGELAINRMTRRYASELVYDTLLYRQQYPDTDLLLRDARDCTLSLTGDGRSFVAAGVSPINPRYLQLTNVLPNDGFNVSSGSVLSLQFPEGREGYK